MKTFIIQERFTGYNDVYIEANSKDEAIEKFGYKQKRVIRLILEGPNYHAQLKSSPGQQESFQ